MSFSEFIWKQLTFTPPFPKGDLSGRTYCVTGANTLGLGREAARHLVRLGAKKVVITARDVAKAAAAKADIEETTGRSGVIDVWPLDLEDYDSIRAFAKRIDTLDRIDGMLLNAAKATAQWQIVNGHESTIAVNVISTIYLTLLLLPKLREGARKYNITPHLSTVSSEVHWWASFRERNSSSIFEAADKREDADMADRYPLSKLLQVFSTREVAKRSPFERDHVIINYLNPGLCRSELGREYKTWAWWLQQTLLARTTEVGGRILVHAVTTAGPESHGRYIDTCKVSNSSPLVEGQDGPEYQNRVWSELSAELEKIQPGILKNLDA
ncbi:hypothetical protein AMS68_002612 [Peltaster fructicola]|uniref:Ketoreductase (KR) domain-containing protein n=1 Tax=Peltaster fructicola TaxID=286661 RepID=A0A6H0XR29_9PEZI|nr:hypothetical protein AMS68_002612 [Peltaster fructicola]